MARQYTAAQKARYYAKKAGLTITKSRRYTYREKRVSAFSPNTLPNRYHAYVERSNNRGSVTLTYPEWVNRYG